MQKSDSQAGPRPRMPRIALFAIAATVLGTTIVACSTRDAFVTFGGGTSDEAGSPPAFVETDGGHEAGTPSVPEPDAEMCVSSECPAPWASCPIFGSLAPYPCGTNTATDTQNCGACGHVCPTGADAFHFRAACVDGQCQPFCQAEWSDCNGLPDDGCESNPKTDPNNCGICGNACAPGVPCLDGKCGCPPGRTSCDGTCVDLADDDDNCGACGFRCRDHQPEDAGALPPNMFYGCHQSTCSVPRCYHDDDVFWVDCNGKQDPDGCEVDLAKPNMDHCGKCGNKCAPNQQCFSTSDTGMDCQCKGTKTFCPAVGWHPAQCADLENDPLNCGSCGYACPTIDGADTTCVNGRCTFACRPEQADCNGLTADGCEVDLMKDPRNCGACGHSCDVAAGQPCVGGQCVTTDCDAGPVH